MVIELNRRGGVPPPTIGGRGNRAPTEFLYAHFSQTHGNQKIPDYLFSLQQLASDGFSFKQSIDLLSSQDKQQLTDLLGGPTPLQHFINASETNAPDAWLQLAKDLLQTSESSSQNLGTSLLGYLSQTSLSETIREQATKSLTQFQNGTGVYAVKKFYHQATDFKMISTMMGAGIVGNYVKGMVGHWLRNSSVAWFAKPAAIVSGFVTEVTTFSVGARLPRSLLLGDADRSALGIGGTRGADPETSPLRGEDFLSNAITLGFLKLAWGGMNILSQDLAKSALAPWTTTVQTIGNQVAGTVGLYGAHQTLVGLKLAQPYAHPSLAWLDAASSQLALHTGAKLGTIVLASPTLRGIQSTKEGRSQSSLHLGRQSRCSSPSLLAQDDNSIIMSRALRSDFLSGLNFFKIPQAFSFDAELAYAGIGSAISWGNHGVSSKNDHIHLTNGNTKEGKKKVWTHNPHTPEAIAAAVQQYGSQSKAARKLGIGGATVSRGMQKLRTDRGEPTPKRGRKPKHTPEAVLAAVKKHGGNQSAAARDLKMDPSQVSKLVRAYEARTGEQLPKKIIIVRQRKPTKPTQTLDEIIAAVKQHGGNQSAAARDLKMSQSQVSKVVRAYEVRTGEQLPRGKSGRPLRPTIIDTETLCGYSLSEIVGFLKFFRWEQRAVAKHLKIKLSQLKKYLRKISISKGIQFPDRKYSFSTSIYFNGKRYDFKNTVWQQKFDAQFSSEPKDNKNIP